MQCKQRDACEARTKQYTDGEECRDQGNNREECIICGFGEVGTDYNCAGKLASFLSITYVKYNMGIQIYI